MARRPRPPAAVLAHVEGRPLVVEELDDGAWVVLTREQVAVVDAEGPRWSRPWHEVDRGEWDGEGHTLTVSFVDGHRPAALRTADEHPRDMPLVFRERVDASIAYSETVDAVGGGRLRGVVRRTPDGGMLSQVLGVGPVRRSPALETQITELEARVRGEVGL
jgi:hypothetical protein